MQGLTLGQPDPEYRATHLESDLQTYYTVLTTYMEDPVPDFTEFMQEVEERRLYGMALFSKIKKS